MKISIIIFVVLCLAHVSWSQLPRPEVVQAPNVAALGTFGSIPVSYATGTPDIAVPLYLISSGETEIPLTLRYHQASVRPADHPGWVGLGWSLSTGGIITRDQHYWPDEMDDYMIYKSYYTSGRYDLMPSDWDSQENLRTYYSVNENRVADTSPDIFSFNFLGYSGKFMLTSAGWKCISDKDIKVEMNSFIKDNIDGRIRTNLPGFNNFAPMQQTRQYYQFTLTTEDGTKYIFGGRDAGNEDAVDYHTPYTTKIQYYYANAWHLIRIIEPSGETIEFKYHRKYPVCNLRFNSSWFEGGGTGAQPCSGWGAQNITTTTHGGTAMFPAYLDEIVWKNGSVKFVTSYSTELRYTDNFFKYFKDGDPNAEVKAEWLMGNGSGVADYNVLKWEQLDELQVKNKSGDVVIKYGFQYSSSPTQRLTLNSLRERNATASENRIHYFYYNNVAGLPDYGGDWTDHWGYFNNRSVNGISFGELETSSNIAKNKQPNESVITTGVLTKMVYPTGGYTEFDWEIHRYGKVVATSKQSLDTQEGIGGGLRIKEIRSYTTTGATPVTKTYYYGVGYNGTPTGLASSGVLNGRPQYYVAVSARSSAFGEYTIWYSQGSVTNSTNYGTFTSGSPVGYTEVIEKNSDGGYSKFIFSGFGTDVFGVSHFDKPASTIGWVAGEDRWITSSSVEHERGKLLQVTHYTNTNRAVERREYRYNDDPNRFNEFLKCTEYTNSISCAPSDALILAAAYKLFTYDYYLKSEKLIQYNDDLTELVTVKNYTYNPMGMRASVSTTQSDGSVRQVLYRYPSDYDNSTYMSACETSRNMCTATVEQQYSSCMSACAGSPGCMAACEAERSGRLGVCQQNYQTCANAYPTANRIIDLKDRHIYSQVVEEQQRITYPDNSTVVAGGTLTLYKSITGGMIVPAEVMTIYQTTPSPTLTLSSIGTNGALTYHPSYSTTTYLDVYDDVGNLLQYHDKNGSVKSYLYGYQKSHPIASATNAGTNSIFFNSFEESTGWDSNLTQYDPAMAHSGQYAGRIDKPTAGELYSHSNTWLTVSLTEPTKFRYSAWVYSNGPSVDVYLFMKTAGESGYYTYVDNVSTTAIGKWVLVEKDFVVPANISRLNIRIDNNGAGSVWFDDVRLHPALAPMKTYTFDPMRGVTSITDENHKSLQYEYDSFNRLKLIRDQDKKIQSQYIYHYQGQY